VRRKSVLLPVLYSSGWQGGHVFALLALPVRPDEGAARHLAFHLLGFSAPHRLRRHPGYDIRARAKTLTYGMRKIADLADVHRDVRVFRGRHDGEGVPLETRDFGHLDEQPLTRGVLEAGLHDAQLHCTAWMDEDAQKSRRAPGAELAVRALAEIQDPRPL